MTHTLSTADDTPSLAPQASPAPVAKSHPIAFWFFFWGEFAERCSFYGMKSILLLYMIDRLHFESGSASRWMNYFKAGCYFLPLLGGYLADRHFGKYISIVAFSIPYILGHVIIGFENVYCLLAALTLLAMGAGVTKPNISTLMGMTYDQQRPGQTQLRSDAFAMFYVAINTGSFVASFAVPLIRNQMGYSLAFLFPAALMCISFALFAVGKPFYAKETIRHAPATAAEHREQRLVLRRLFGLFAVIIFFWVILEQYDSTWILFARDHVDLNVFDFQPGSWQSNTIACLRDRMHIAILGQPLVADQFQVLNPILVMVLVPIAAVGWRLLARAGLRLRPTDKMLIGFGLTLATPLILCAAAALAGGSGRVSAWWLFAAYFIVTLAEVCISVTALELAFTAAPDSMKSFVTACWLLTMSCGDFINAQITPYYDEPITILGHGIRLTPPVYFGLFTLLMIPVVIAFLFIARRFNCVTPRHEDNSMPSL